MQSVYIMRGIDRKKEELLSAALLRSISVKEMYHTLIFLPGGKNQTRSQIMYCS